MWVFFGPYNIVAMTIWQYLLVFWTVRVNWDDMIAVVVGFLHPRSQLRCRHGSISSIFGTVGHDCDDKVAVSLGFGVLGPYNMALMNGWL